MFWLGDRPTNINKEEKKVKGEQYKCCNSKQAVMCGGGSLCSCMLTITSASPTFNGGIVFLSRVLYKTMLYKIKKKKRKRKRSDKSNLAGFNEGR